MKPMTLKKPADCCGTLTLMWIIGDSYFMCPCGKLKADVRGQEIKAGMFNARAFGRGRPKKGQERRPKEIDSDTDTLVLDRDEWN